MAVLAFAASAVGQTVAQARVIRPAVIVELPRGDSPVVTTVPPGVVVNLFFSDGDWYQVALVSEARRPVGWIHRETVEVLPSQPPIGAAPGPGFPARPAAVAPVAQQEESGQRRLYLRPGVTELAISADVSGISFAGETSGTASVSGIIGFVIPKNLEVVILPQAIRPYGGDAYGSIGAGLFVNFNTDAVAIPFVGGAVGTTFGTSSLFVNETQYLDVSGGVRLMMPGGGGSIILRPYFQRYFTSSDLLAFPDINTYGLSIGASVLFGN